MPIPSQQSTQNEIISDVQNILNRYNDIPDIATPEQNAEINQGFQIPAGADNLIDRGGTGGYNDE